MRDLLLESTALHLQVLMSALQVAVKHDVDARNWLTPLGRKRLGEITVSDQTAWVWIIVLMQFDADAGFDILEQWTNDLAPDATSDMAVRLCASPANRRQRSVSTSESDFLRPKFLLRFIPWVFRFVRPENDPVRGRHSGFRRTNSHRLGGSPVRSAGTGKSDS